MTTPSSNGFHGGKATNSAADVTIEADDDDDLLEDNNTAISLPYKNGQTPESTTPTSVSSSSIMDDTTESSFGGDYIGVFRSYLHGTESVETTRRRLVLTRAERHAAAKQQQKQETAMPSNISSSTGERSTSATKAQTKPKTRRIGFVLMRTVLLDLPLALLMATWIAAFLVQRIYTNYYFPLIARARRGDDQLLEEFTYYERQCTEYDLSTRNIQDLLLVSDNDDDNNNNKNSILANRVNQMLQHGVAVVPSVLSLSTVAALREFIVEKNSRISDAEAYPMSQGHRRLSYGIDAAEDPRVSAAIREVAHHAVLRPLLVALLGDVDPASAEITSITAYDGAAMQGWHQDTKQDGNALKFARTYSHSYSLFLPLQNVTERMGATDFCPGTHYCANDLTELCEETKLGLHLAGGNATDPWFPAGAGALLNQHVWHRGGAHTDPQADERIVFILSFLARPDFVNDPRQLSRGTYFHLKWNMWGHTWRDLMDPESRMQHPLSLLRCLSLWKQSTANWGYDLITSGLMRFANEQLEYNDFSDRFLPYLDQIGLPHFLRGPVMEVDSQADMWTIFIRDTIGNIYRFVSNINVVAHCVYILSLLACAIWWSISLSKTAPPYSGMRLLHNAAVRLIFTHGVLLLMGLALWRTVCMSTWGRSVSSGLALMRPFPPQEKSSSTLAVTASKGVTTMPNRNDVLLGTRFDADFLGSYNQWLDFHPGNSVYRRATSSLAPSFAKNINSVSLWRQSIAQQVIEELRATGGRFLWQDFSTGDWLVLTASERSEAVMSDLVTASIQAIAAIRPVVDRMIALQRFGPQRSTVMGRFATLRLWHLRRDIMVVGNDTCRSSDQSIVPHNRAKQRPNNINWNIALPTVPSTSKLVRVPKFAQRGGGPLKSWGREDATKLKAGSLIWAIFSDDGEWFPGTVLSVDHTGEWLDISFDDNTREVVFIQNVRKLKPITEGDRVEGCFGPTNNELLEECYPGTIRRVLPGGYVSIAYDDGTTYPLMPPSRYFVPPFRYGGPFYP